MDSVNEFKCLPVECGDKGAGHYLFIKKCESTKPSVERPPGRTLAIFNIPEKLTMATLILLFQVAGSTTRITRFNSFENSKRTIKTESKIGSASFNKNEIIKDFYIAYMVYKETESIDLILNLKKLTIQEGELQRYGVMKWAKPYNGRIMHMVEIQKAVEEFMEKYDTVEDAETEYVNAEDAPHSQLMPSRLGIRRDQRFKPF